MDCGRKSFTPEPVSLISGFILILALFVGNDHQIARAEHVGVLTNAPQIGVVRVVPDGVGEEAALQRDAGNAVVDFGDVKLRHVEFSW